MVWKSITRLFGGPSSDDQARLQSFLDLSRALLIRTLPREARQKSLLEGLGHVGFDFYCKALLKRSPQFLGEMLEPAEDKSESTSLRLDEAKISKNLFAVIDNTLTLTESHGLTWIEPELLLVGALTVELEEPLFNKLSEVQVKILSPLLLARAMRVEHPKKALEQLSLVPVKNNDIPAVEIYRLKARLLLWQHFEDPKADTKTWLAALKDACAAVESSLRELEQDDDMAKSLQVPVLRNWLEDKFLLGDIKAADKRLTSLEADENTWPWEQIDDLKGQLTVLKHHQGNDTARVLCLKAREKRLIMDEFSRRSDEESVNENLAEDFWNRATKAHQQASEWLEEAAEEDSQWAWPCLQRSEIAGMNKDLVFYGAGFPKDEALEWLDRGLERSPKAWILEHRKGRLHQRDSDQGGLVEPESEAAKTALETFYKAAEAKQALPAIHGATLATDRAMRLKHDDPLEHKDCLKQAIRLYQQVRETRPEDEDAIRGLAYVQNQNGLFEEAVATAQEGLKINPKSAELNYVLADLYRSAGQRDEFQKYIEKTLDIDPEHPDALMTMAESLMESND